MMVPLLVTTGASLVSDSDKDGPGGGRVKRKALSILMIWLKLGLRLGSSTQHDWMIKASSWEISSGILGLSCCNQNTLVFSPSIIHKLMELKNDFKKQEIRTIL